MRIDASHDDSGDSGFQKGFGTRPSPTFEIAWLERYCNRSPTHALLTEFSPGRRECNNFGVRPRWLTFGRPTPEDFIAAKHNGTHARIRERSSVTPRRCTQRDAHHLLVPGVGGLN
jgi:hypothetical protein